MTPDLLVMSAYINASMDGEINLVTPRRGDAHSSSVINGI